MYTDGFRFEIGDGTVIVNLAAISRLLLLDVFVYREKNNSIRVIGRCVLEGCEGDNHGHGIVF